MSYEPLSLLLDSIRELGRIFLFLLSQIFWKLPLAEFEEMSSRSRAGTPKRAKSPVTSKRKSRRQRKRRRTMRPRPDSLAPRPRSRPDAWTYEPERQRTDPIIYVQASISSNMWIALVAVSILSMWLSPFQGLLRYTRRCPLRWMVGAQIVYATQLY